MGDEEDEIIIEPHQPQPDQNLKCLIVNDESMQLTILKMIFQGQNLECDIARNGYEAFTML